MKQTKRFVTKRVPMTKEESLNAWRLDVLCAFNALEEAIKTKLPTHKTEFIEVKKGDPKYAKATHEYSVTWSK